MNIFNVLLSAALAIFVFGSIYFIKLDSKKSNINKTPNFISTKFSETNLRTGPSLDYPIIYTYKQKRLPLKVIDNYQEWYQIKDIYGRKGWVYKNLVNSQKYGIITKESNVYISNNNLSKIIAIIKPFNIVKIVSCKSLSLHNLCKIEFYIEKYKITYKGWIYESAIWGDTQNN